MFENQLRELQATSTLIGKRLRLCLIRDAGMLEDGYYDLEPPRRFDQYLYDKGTHQHMVTANVR